MAFKQQGLLKAALKRRHVGSLNANIMLKTLRHEHVLLFGDDDSECRVFHCQ
jgi:hypothetical protein